MPADHAGKRRLGSGGGVIAWKIGAGDNGKCIGAGDNGNGGAPGKSCVPGKTVGAGAYQPGLSPVNFQSSSCNLPHIPALTGATAGCQANGGSVPAHNI